MADKLKVFKNQVNAAASTSLSAVSISVLTTDSTTQAVVKDLNIGVKHPTAAYDGVYKYPLTVKLNGFPLEAQSTGSSLVLTGSQIVDANSSVTVEVGAETQQTYYGETELMLPFNGTNYYKLGLGSIGDPAGKGVAILSALKAAAVNISTSQLVGDTGCTIVRNGQVLFCYINGSQLSIIDSKGASVATLSGFGTTIRAICADATYIYGKDDSYSNNIYRWSISTLTQAATLSCNTSMPGFTNSNKGFIDHYNGTIYYRASGSDGTVYKINTSNGSVTTRSTSAQSECIGGLVTVSTSGVPYLVEYQDTQYMAWNLSNDSIIYGGAVFPTDPTTTQGNRAAVIANGIVLFNNGNYGYTAIVDVNGSSPTATNVTSTFPLGNIQGVMISKPFQTAPAQVAREIQYNLLASGIEVTN